MTDSSTFETTTVENLDKPIKFEMVCEIDHCRPMYVDSDGVARVDGIKKISEVIEVMYDEVLEKEVT